MAELAAEDRATVLDAVLDRITYANAGTGQTIARVAPRDGADHVTAVGPLSDVRPGEVLRLAGRWTSHPAYGRQFEVSSFVAALPTEPTDITRYLASGSIKGVDPALAQRLVHAFGADALTVLDREPDRLTEVPGVGPRRAADLARAWQEHRAVRELTAFLRGVGAPTGLATRIHQVYGADSRKVARGTPYRLAVEVPGVGLATADLIGAAAGIAGDAPQRVQAGLLVALAEAAGAGHCFLPEPRLVVAARRILGVDPVRIRGCLADLAAAEGVVREDVPGAGQDGAPVAVRAVYLPALHRAEIALANGLLRLLHNGSDRLPMFSTVDWQRARSWLRAQGSVPPTDEQWHAVRLALTSRLAVVTGAAGSGRSTTVAALVALAVARQATVVVLAPGGPAAERLSTVVGQEVTTIHRLLGDPADPTHDRSNPVDADLIVVSDVSTVDLATADRLVTALADGAHLVLVGDPDQLPSAGAGDVLRDLLAAHRVPRVALTAEFRSGPRAGVVANARRINGGQPPVTTGLADFFLFPCADGESAAELLVDVATRRIPARFGLDPARDVQVLTATRAGPIGADALNVLLQEALTPADADRPQHRYGGVVFRSSDRVIGPDGVAGTITGLSTTDGMLTVRTGDGPVDHDLAVLDGLTHGYAATVEHAQAGEFPAVVLPISAGTTPLFDRPQLYTAVTRARRLVVLVGSRPALEQAVRVVGSRHRRTSLTHRLTST